MKRGSVTLCFYAPVYVVVEQAGATDKPHIAKVVVDDENTDTTQPTSAVDHEAHDLPLSDPDVVEALAVINSTDNWPDWEFGW